MSQWPEVLLLFTADSNILLYKIVIVFPMIVKVSSYFPQDSYDIFYIGTGEVYFSNRLVFVNNQSIHLIR